MMTVRVEVSSMTDRTLRLDAVLILAPGTPAVRNVEAIAFAGPTFF